MTAEEYRGALATLGLTQAAAGRWLGVSLRTAQEFAASGPSGPAARAVLLLLHHVPPSAREAALTAPFR